MVGEKQWMLRHWCTEGDAPGGNLLYRRQITATKAGMCHIRMPNWFEYLAKNVMVFCTGVRHLGIAWGEQDEKDGCLINVTTNRSGLFNVLITGDRNDHCATNICSPELEFRGERLAQPPPIRNPQL